MKKLIICAYLWAVVMALGVWDYYILKFPPCNLPRVYQEVLMPVVRITCPDGIGSGVVIGSLQASSSRLQNVVPSGSRVNGLTSSNYVLTAAHVVDNNSQVQVHIYDYELGVVTIKSATVIITDTIKDLALLRCESGVRRYACARLAPRNYTPHLFTEVYAVGCSLGLNPRPSEGIITAISPSPFPSHAGEGLGEGYWEISAPILPGNSGGGVFLKDTHELIGITVWVRLYHVPNDVAHDGNTSGSRSESSRASSFGRQLVTTMAGIVPINQIYEFLNNNRITPRGSWGGFNR